MIRTSEHDLEWQENFAGSKDRPQVQEAHRLAGDIDYILKVRVKMLGRMMNFTKL